MADKIWEEVGTILDKEEWEGALDAIRRGA